MMRLTKLGTLAEIEIDSQNQIDFLGSTRQWDPERVIAAGLLFFH